MTLPIEVSQDDLKNLQNQLPLVSSIESKLEHMSEGVRSEFAQLKEALYKLFEEHERQEKLVFEAKYEYFDRIREQNDFNLIWSDYSVDVDGINACFGEVSALTYQGKSIAVNKSHAQFLDVWRAADSLLKDESRYIFLECFIPSKDDPTVFEIVLGS